MKYKLLSALVAGSIALAGCGSDDPIKPEDPVVVVPPVVVEPPAEVTTIDANDALAINLAVTSYDVTTGAIQFDLTDADGLPITNAKDYDIAFMGFPDPTEKSSNPKAWKRWHVAQMYRCDTSSDIACDGVLTESATKGSYSFSATDLDLSTDDPAEAVKTYKVGIAIKGANATNVVELLQPTS